MVPPSFQKTLFQLENKLRQMQTLERTVLQAAALEDENVAYCTASQLVDACEQAVLLARALPACSQYECSAKGDRERTEIYVVPETEFPQWLLSEKSMPEEGVELLENRP